MMLVSFLHFTAAMLELEITTTAWDQLEPNFSKNAFTKSFEVYEKLICLLYTLHKI